MFGRVRYLDEELKTPRLGILVERMAPFADWGDAHSWLGGRPVAAPDFDWPRSPITGKPLHFLAQIDCGRVPPRPREAEGFPSTGCLLFFAETNAWLTHHEPSFAVRYLPPESMGGAVPLTEPADTPPVGLGLRTAKSAEEPGAEFCFRRWPVRFVPFETSNEEGARAEAIEQATGPRLRQSLRMHLWQQREEQRFEHPFAWEQVFRETAILIRKLPEVRRRVRSYVTRDGGEVAGWEHWFSAEEARLQEWLRRAEQEGRLTTVAANDRQAFRSLTQGFPDHLAKEAEHAIHLAIDETVWTLVTSGEAARALIPPALREDVESLEPGNTWGPHCVHQMFGWGRLVQDAAVEHIDDVLLMQFDSDDRMGWCWGDVGALQFWISPRALKRQWWDAVSMSSEGG